MAKILEGHSGEHGDEMRAWGSRDALSDLNAFRNIYFLVGTFTKVCGPARFDVMHTPLAVCSIFLVLLI